MPEAKDGKSAEAPEKKKKPPIMIIVAVVALVAIAAGLTVGKTVFAKSKGAQKQKEVPGPIMPLDEFLVNLADPSGDHFLKVTVNLELKKESGKTPETLKDQTAPIRDAVLTALCSKTRDQITPLTGRDALKTEIRKDVNATLGEDDVENVYFSDFVTQ